MKVFWNRLRHLFSDDDINERLALIALMKDLQRKIGILMDMNKALAAQIVELQLKLSEKNIPNEERPEATYRREK